MTKSEFKLRYISRIGRMSRQEFWRSMSILLLALMGGIFVVQLLVWLFNLGPMVQFAAFVMLAMAFQRPLQALSAKRLHDFNQTGWWFFPFYFLLYLFLLAAFNLAADPLTGEKTLISLEILSQLVTDFPVAIAAPIYILFYLISLYVIPGNKDENQFG